MTMKRARFGISLALTSACLLVGTIVPAARRASRGQQRPEEPGSQSAEPAKSIGRGTGRA